MTAIRKEVIGDCTLYLGDCRDVLPTLAKVDAVITDPPYGQALKTARSPRAKKHHRGFANDHVTYGKAYKPIVGDDAAFDPRPLIEIASKAVIWGAHIFFERLPAGRLLVWDKRVGVVPPNDQGCGEIAWSNTPGLLRIHRQLWSGMVRSGDHFRTGQASSGRAHPTEKPVALMSWCIDQVQAEGIVLDPYMGVGSTGVAAVIKGLPFIGCEIEEEYFDVACHRIEEAFRQPDIFATASATPKPVQGALEL